MVWNLGPSESRFVLLLLIYNLLNHIKIICYFYFLLFISPHFSWNKTELNNVSISTNRPNISISPNISLGPNYSIYYPVKKNLNIFKQIQIENCLLFLKHFSALQYQNGLFLMASELSTIFSLILSKTKNKRNKQSSLSLTST